MIHFCEKLAKTFSNFVYQKRSKISHHLGIMFVALTIATPHSMAQTDVGADQSQYTSNEILSSGHQFFGSVSQGLASTIESVFSRYGRPNAYILGQEGAGAFIGGLKYGEGTLYTKEAGQHKTFWQGPSIGWDFGGNGSRTMMLVYKLETIEAMYRRYGGIGGSAYVIGGFGVSAHHNHDTIVVPIRSGVGARLGVNIGYLKFTPKATWNPF